MKISVVILARNCEDTISDCLESILNQSVWLWHEREIIVVVNGCSDNTEAIVRRYPVHAIVVRRPLGAAGAINTGFKASSGEIVFFAFGDAKYSENFLEYCIGHFNDAVVGSVCGTHLYWGENRKSLLSKFFIQQREIVNTNYIPIVGWVYKRDCLEKLVGPGDRLANEDIAAYDVLLTQQLKEKGYKLVWEPRAYFWHGKDYNTYTKIFMKGFVFGQKLYQHLRTGAHLNLIKPFLIRIFLITINLIVFATIFLSIPYLGLKILWVLSFAGIQLSWFWLVALLHILRKKKHPRDFKTYLLLFPIVYGTRYFGILVGFFTALLFKKLRKYHKLY